jgi:hypothetical protein
MYIVLENRKTLRTKSTMVVGSPGRSEEVPTDDGFTHPVRKLSRKQQLASAKKAIGNALETTKENENEYQDDCEDNDEIEVNGNIHIYNIRLNTTLPKGFQAHKPLWILKELLLHLKKADPKAGFLTAVATGDEDLHSKTKRAITPKNKLSGPKRSWKATRPKAIPLSRSTCTN